MNTCCIPLVSTGDACGKPATHLVTFSDGDKATACHPCALALQQTAKMMYKTEIRVEKI